MIAWSRLLDLFKYSDNKARIALTVLVGFLTGVAAWLFIRLVEWSQFWPAAPTFPRWALILIPTLGGLLCGLVVQYAEPSAKGTGTADLMYSLRREGGHLSGRYTFFKMLASILTICSGGAAGPEAPGVAVGAGIGSLLGQWRRFEPGDRLNLVVSGAAAGFAAVFNAPIAGRSCPAIGIAEGPQASAGPP